MSTEEQRRSREKLLAWRRAKKGESEANLNVVTPTAAPTQVISEPRAFDPQLAINLFSSLDLLMAINGSSNNTTTTVPSPSAPSPAAPAPTQPIPPSVVMSPPVEAVQAAALLVSATPSPKPSIPAAVSKPAAMVVGGRQARKHPSEKTPLTQDRLVSLATVFIERMTIEEKERYDRTVCMIKEVPGDRQLIADYCDFCGLMISKYDQKRAPDTTINLHAYSSDELVHACAGAGLLSIAPSIATSLASIAVRGGENLPRPKTAGRAYFSDRFRSPVRPMAKNNMDVDEEEEVLESGTTRPLLL